MATFEYNDRIKFLLPSGFIFSRDEDEDGNEIVSILTGEYENDDGETCYSFNCRVNYNEYDPADCEEDITSTNLLEKLAERMENSRRMKLPGTPETILVNKGIPLSIFGHVIKMFGTVGLIRVSDWDVVQLVTSSRFNDDDPESNKAVYENMYEVLKAIRVNGKKVSIDVTTPAQIQDALELSFEEDGTIDVSPKLQFNFTAGDETTTYEYTADGMKEVGKEYLTRVSPKEELYPHYNSIRSAGGFGFLGASVVVNASGTEYHFIPLRESAESDETDEEMKALCNRIISKDNETYDLDLKAKEMQKLFHVNESAFDPRHDRECELEEGYLHRAYMMSGLRSFAWTLADYCKQHDCTPDDIDSTIASRVANFAAHEDWLNYDDTTYCQGLCSGSDLHVFFIPDGVSQADRKKLLPTKEDYDRVKKMKEKFPTYREILSEVHSLNALRKDLKYIYPAVRVMWDKLAEDRDYDEALTGNEADIIYAWCALSLAAKEPFFSEDGPTSCYFSQIIDEEAQAAKWEAEEAERAEEAAEEWMRKYEKYLETDPSIEFNGSIFVFSGLAGHWEEKDHPIVQKVLERGGQYRSKVSGLTNYLVVDPGYAGQSKIVAVMEQRQKGKNVKVILLEDLKKALDKPAESKKSSAPAAKTTSTAPKTSSPKQTTKVVSSTSENSKPTRVSKPVAGTKVSKNDCFIDDSGTITGYVGKAKAVVLPDGIQTIGEDAFFGKDITSIVIPEGVETIENGAFWLCDKLKSVTLPSTIKKIGDNAFNSCKLLSIITIPDGCEEIGKDCFTGCEKLKDIYVPASVRRLGDDAFYTFCDAMIIHTPKGSTAEKMAKDHDWKVDYKSVSPAAKPTVQKPASTKSASSSNEVDGLADTMSDLSAQVAEMQKQTLSDEDRQKLNEAMGTLGSMMDDLSEGTNKYTSFLEQKEAREKAAEAEKARRKAEGMAAGKSENDIVNMYIILTNEKKLGKLHRSQDEFYELYEEDFPALSKAEVIKVRKDMLKEMEDDSLCSYYAESFKQRTVEDRFSVSTRNLNNVSDETELGIKADWAVENSKEWYAPSEYTEVRRLMDKDLAETRRDLDGQLKSIDEAWIKFSTAKEYLQINISNKKPDGSDLQPLNSNFQVVIGSQLVAVKLASKGFFRMSTTVMNPFTWYWGVSVRDIWETALKNDLYDEREGASNGSQLANQAISRIRATHPDTKVASVSQSSTNNTRYSPSSYSASARTNTSSSVNTTSASQANTQPKKKEGCYIATAVYGSYDAPQVLTLRRYRDETLKKSAFGRWFIKTYYKLSPPIANKLKNAKKTNSIVRSALDRWVERLNRKQK